MLIKKRVLLGLLMLLPFMSWGQNSVQMLSEGGQLKIPSRINGVSVKFVFSEGIDDIQLSETTVYFLLEQGYISKEDIQSSVMVKLADGTQQKGVNVHIASIEIAGLALKNVTAHMLFGRDANVAIGKKALEQLGSVAISGNTLTIHSNDREELLRERGQRFFNAGNYASAADCYNEIWSGNGLYEREFRILMQCYLRSGQKPKAKHVCEEWIKNYDKEDRYEIYKGEVYQVLGESILDDYWRTSWDTSGKYKEAALWFQKALSYYKPGTKEYALCELETGKALFPSSKQQGGEYFNKALRSYLSAIQKSQSDVDRRMVKDTGLATIYRVLAKYYQDIDYSLDKYYDNMVRAYFCGDQSAYDEAAQYASSWNAACNRVYKK